MILLVFFIILSVTAIGLIKFRRKLAILFLLKFFLPTIIITNEFCSDRSITSTQKVGLANPLISFIDLVIEFSHHNGMQHFDGSRDWYYSTLLLIQGYSLFLIFFLYTFLKSYTLKSILANFKHFVTIFYNKIYVWLLILLLSAGTVIFSNRHTMAISIKGFSNTYSALYFFYLTMFFILIYFVMREFFFFEKRIKSIMLFLVLAFPTISLSGEYRAISLCFIEDSTFENHLAIYPLIYALPKTILSFFDYSDNEKFSYNLIPKIYSILQIFTIIILFPTLLNVNNENKK